MLRHRWWWYLFFLIGVGLLSRLVEVRLACSRVQEQGGPLSESTVSQETGEPQEP
jgi:hypothetical protein